jgi:hypothetical protein
MKLQKPSTPAVKKQVEEGKTKIEKIIKKTGVIIMLKV